MVAQLQGFFAEQATLLGDRQVTRMARAYRVPLLVYLLHTERWHLLQTRQNVLEALYAKHRGVSAAGVGRLRTMVTQERFSGPERAQADVTWFYVGDGGRRLGRTMARYFLSRRGSGFNVDMIEFQKIAFPQMNDWFGENSKPLPLGVSPHF